MAHIPLSNPTPIPTTFEENTLAIGGKLITATWVMQDIDMMSFKSDAEYKDAVKAKLANELVKHMMDNKLIEFTSTQNHSYAKTTVRARCYLAKDSDIKLIRTKVIG